ncbi:MAG: hypothetical protein JKX91_04005 [Rhizobiaceae bacterium]|nr:hypothetical protein [Rhizobiaceae bacterium]
MVEKNAAVTQYFDALMKALAGLDMYLREDDSPLYKHDLIGSVVAGYLKRMDESLESWENRISFTDHFRISRSESGFPVFQNVLELENDRRGAEKRLAALPDDERIREEMVEYILKKKAFPAALQKTMSERCYLETLMDGAHFSPLNLPKTVRVSVNPKTGRPYYVVHWGAYDGSANLPMVYMATIEDSSDDMVETLVKDGKKLSQRVDIPLPVEGLLIPKLARQFDDFCEKNSAYSLTLSTIATNLDHDFEHLHPKQLRRFVLGPFYHAGITEHGHKVDQILQKVKRPENAWLLTWTLQELYSYNEKPAKWGLWNSSPAREEFFINTDDLDCARQGVSAFQRHALVPHEAYQAIYAAGEEGEIFDGYEKHIISGDQVLRNM